MVIVFQIMQRHIFFFFISHENPIENQFFENHLSTNLGKNETSHGKDHTGDTSHKILVGTVTFIISPLILHFLGSGSLPKAKGLPIPITGMYNQYNA